MLSGGFSIIHIGHVRLIEAAAEYGRVIVALNSDEWLSRKITSPHVTWSERAEVLMALRHVELVIPVEDSDGTVCKALEKIKPMYFCNGGDRTTADPREHEVCERLGIYELFGVGGDKIRSSREFLLRNKGVA